MMSKTTILFQDIVVVKPIMGNVEETERPIEGRPPPLKPDEESVEKTKTEDDTDEKQVTPPKTIDNCRLPYYPASDPDAGSTYRLGNNDHYPL